MRLVSYNILDGGEGRADPLAEVIDAQRPDMVALIEADNPAVVERIARRLNMDSIAAPGCKHTVALLSRWPIVESINHAALRGRPPCLLEATIRQLDGPEWLIGVLHLGSHAFEADEAQREQELAAVLEVFEPYRRVGCPHLLVGDFNSNSPIQQIDPDKVHPKTRQAWLANGSRIPRRVIQTLLDNAYIDTLAAAYPDAAPTTATFTTRDPGQRIDFIFAYATQPTAIKDAWVEHDRLAKYASDHYPIGVELV
jgi:endonuclease/exonuclease/phosphatase family metal-dependent hydrolase